MGENGNPLEPGPQSDETAGAAVSDTGIRPAGGAGPADAAQGPPGPPGAPPARRPAGSPSPSASGAAPASLIGLTVSHYRILERLGGGGMGVVYKAWDLRLERHAALKFLSPQRSSSEDFKRRFAREARTASRLEHPNICTVFETDESEDGRLFIAMAFCDGESLKRKIERGPLPIAQALSVAGQVAAGLGAAHEKSIVHRDIKPGNIMVAADGRVKIVDFGIARLADQTRMTRAGDLMGTTAYVAPEQFVEEGADHRADLWSLGVVVYEMVTGRLPWSGADDRELVSAIVKRQPRPLSSWRLDVPPALERVVARALAKRPAERYQRAEELRADLDEIAATVTPPAVAFPSEQTLVEAPQLAAAGERGAAARSGEDSRQSAGGASPAGGDAGMGAMGGIASWSAQGPQGLEQRPASGPIGRTVGHYRIVAPLGGGGMGIVYRAQDLTLERTVALKFLPPELTRDPEAKTRFLQEARAASALDHPNICTIYEVAEADDGQLYLAMACYDGETLKQRLQKGRLPIDEALETAQQVARGLVKAHRHGIVHRDIKPANVMVTTDEIVKILDFGIAKLLGAAGLTRVGSSLGTPAYMSPEQARGEEVDPRTDVWSLGAVLYEMVTGRRPFRGEHEQTVLYSLFNEEPEPVLQLRPDAPPELARIVGRMLAKDPEQRYPTAAAALADLRSLYGPVTGTLTGSLIAAAAAPPAAPKPQPNRGKHWIRAAVAAGILAACAAVYLLRHQIFRPPLPVQPSIARLTNFDGNASYPSLSPEGQFFVYVREVGGHAHIFWQRVEGENTTDLTKDSTADNTQPAISPDGQQIAFRSERDGGGIFIMGSTGESVHRLTSFGFNPSWSPNGADIVIGTEGIYDPSIRRTLSQLWRVNVATTEVRQLPTGDAVQPSWSPKGLRIAFWGREAGSVQRCIWTIPADGGAPVLAVKDENLNWDPVWSPDGNYLYYASNRNGPMTFWRVPIDEATGKTSGDPEAHTMPAVSSAFLTFAHDGRRFAYASDEKRSTIEMVAFDPLTGAVMGAPAQILSGARVIQSINASPDGKWLVYDTLSPGDQLFIVRSDGSEERRLTHDSSRYRVPRWSPDGTSLSFYSNRDGDWRAWTMRPDGSHLELLSDTPQIYDPVWSPDGKSLACDIGSPSAFSLIDLTRPRGERKPTPLLPAGQPFAPFSWSMDGRRLSGEVDLKPGIYVYTVASHSLGRAIADAGFNPTWLHDNHNLLYVRDGKVMIADADTRVSRLVLAPPPSSAYTLGCSTPDDRTLYLLRTATTGDIWLGRTP
jgi:serine/threonine protein kinase